MPAIAFDTASRRRGQPAAAKSLPHHLRTLSLDAATRIVLALAVVFTLFFVGVVATGLMGALKARETARLAQQDALTQSTADAIATRLAKLTGELDGAALAYSAFGDGDTATASGLIAALEADALIAQAAIIPVGVTGQSRLAAPRSRADSALETALSERGVLQPGVWIAPGPDGALALYAAADVRLANGRGVLAARASTAAMSPFVRDVPLSVTLNQGAGSGMVLFAPAGDLAAADDEAATQTRAQVPGTRLTVNLTHWTPPGAPGVLDLIGFYALLLAAPIVVAMSLGAILLVQLDRIREANLAKTAFLANMSHELRTPLNAINGFSEAMTQELFGPVGCEKYREYSDIIHRSGTHLLDLITDILDMSKIEAGKLDLSPEYFDLNELIHEAVTLVDLRAEQAGLVLEVSRDELPQLLADKRAVRQILLNLLSNALKFTESGGRITLTAKRIGEAVFFSVADNGVGIASDDLDRLGQPFEQVAQSPAAARLGTGLGLALSRSLVELHGGEFVISSALGQGTQVSFTLPLQADHTALSATAETN